MSDKQNVDDGHGDRVAGEEESRAEQQIHAHPHDLCAVPTTETHQEAEEPGGCLPLLLFWLGCASLPYIGIGVSYILFPPSLLYLPAVIGMVLAVCCGAAYMRFGPRPFPGLLPGTLSLMMICVQLGACNISLLLLGRFFKELAKHV